MNDQTIEQYCVAAANRNTGFREAITGAQSYQAALLMKGAMNKQSTWKQTHKYFHVAKYPYKSHKNS